ncbi:hypothetical protein [Moraxella lacunata]
MHPNLNFISAVDLSDLSDLPRANCNLHTINFNITTNIMMFGCRAW